MSNRTGWRLIQRSTLAFIREARKTRKFSFYDWLHGYFYARFPYLYIGIGKGKHPIARFYLRLQEWIRKIIPVRNPRARNPGTPDKPSGTIADTYHGKVLPLDHAKRLVMVQEEIRIEDLEKIIPYPLARDLILKQPDHIVALDCPCRVNQENPCLPLDVCLIVGEPFASFVAEHHPGRTRWINQSEAVEILEAEHRRGHVHHAFFKDAMLRRYYAICNCCSCCCGAMKAHQNGVPMLVSSGYVARVDIDLCIACQSCEEHCQFGAITYSGHAVIDSAVCMGCGVCVSSCSNEAISLVLSPQRGQPLDIQTLVG